MRECQQVRGKGNSPLSYKAAKKKKKKKKKTPHDSSSKLYRVNYRSVLSTLWLGPLLTKLCNAPRNWACSLTAAVRLFASSSSGDTL